ncbi:MAG: hypothetical protein A2275_17025 [Bacteroidetes bacterium RIFOXYA12_FULL_35_11]|nr:MAG: hypothetical protein A2X01_18160 [Bacteroidetes bacterium GWF2_35_48]OFY83393.1 MAG: hypothetical protein A2275_17025 [Bacteroidetes bacterium RIFOXYA12_FULL_35_11]OFY92048.1 MAG: hypothetical protein A2309_11595 [Bacteroidetes bacterium RIFOXYB2_FULL_35_7]OFZ01687.1 MAG: hypothetical protein A2491_01540 [Bacteroidetes bacterium RIFOXYC12_FULL_35_7]HBX51696.1 hypothetical protein [Bacteroidales bacterium]
MKETIKPISIEIKGKTLESAYSVYIVVVYYGSKKYFYIGQTGDTKAISARSPFYRISAHLSYYAKSSQNQIFEGMADLLGKTYSDRESMENILKESTIQIHSFPVIAFSYKTKEANDLDTHHNHRKIVLKIEKAAIKWLAKHKKEHFILNKNYNKIPQNCVDVLSEDSHFIQITQFLQKLIDSENPLETK